MIKGFLVSRIPFIFVQLFVSKHDEQASLHTKFDIERILLFVR